MQVQLLPAVPIHGRLTGMAYLPGSEPGVPQFESEGGYHLTRPNRHPTSYPDTELTQIAQNSS